MDIRYDSLCIKPGIYVFYGKGVLVTIMHVPQLVVQDTLLCIVHLLDVASFIFDSESPTIQKISIIIEKAS